MTTISSDPLMTSSYQHAVRLYDAEALMEVSPDLAHGYLVLLSSNTNEDLTLAFASLVDGNVLDACFGSRPQDKHPSSNPKWQECRVAKAALSAASDSSQGLAQLAVETYTNAFTIVLNYHSSVKRMNWCIRCFRGRSKRVKAKHDLEQAFRTLTHAVCSSTR